MRRRYVHALLVDLNAIEDPPEQCASRNKSNQSNLATARRAQQRENSSEKTSEMATISTADGKCPQRLGLVVKANWTVCFGLSRTATK